MRFARSITKGVMNIINDITIIPLSNLTIIPKAAASRSKTDAVIIILTSLFVYLIGVL